MQHQDLPNYGAATYGDRFADVYDAWHAPTDKDTDAAVAFLAELAGQGRVLELGIGTGRVALPLAARGLDVHGIDASPRMVERLRAKPGGTQLPVVIGDFADVGYDGSFALVYVVFNTFFALLSQEEQVRCFAGVTARLDQGGAFAIEAFVPDPSRFDRGQRVQVTELGDAEVRLQASRHDSVTQRVSSQDILVAAQETRLYPVQLRYAWPAELDLMARLAGLRLAGRWGDWNREPFTTASTRHVSVYRKHAG
ncbi:MAG: class I SAM-dependent DNA methyltransferase [Nocardioidaceae bacterium]